MAEGINQRPETGMRCEGKSILANGCEIFTTGWVSSAAYFQAGSLPLISISGVTCSSYIFELSKEGTMSNSVYTCTNCGAFPLTGTLTVSVPGASAYSWSPGTYLSATNVAAPTYSITTCAASTVNYSVTVTSSVCAVVAPVSLVTVVQSSANAGLDQLVCPNVPCTLGTAAVTGYTYAWAPSTNLNSTSAAQPVYSNTTTLVLPRTYVVTATDICGNVTTDYVTISNNPSCRVANPNQPTAEVFPNPSSGIFSVNLAVAEEESDVEFVVTDLSGRVVQQSTLTTAGGPIALDLSGEAKGVYMLSVTRDGVTEMHKLIIE
jgi:hypothetical protein